ncbi:Uncharacterized protein Fot_34046 [Forsythia ovata]|uniref:Uncharacterized protein n=1 Tax=Forsythia ovata TaxID=205694 RepID=A0ABD1TCG8_9LAMI
MLKEMPKTFNIAQIRKYLATELYVYAKKKQVENYDTDNDWKKQREIRYYNLEEIRFYYEFGFHQKWLIAAVVKKGSIGYPQLLRPTTPLLGYQIQDFHSN